MKYIIILILSVFTMDTFACSCKDQIIISFNSKEKSEVPHKIYAQLGKMIFDNAVIADNLHAYTASTNHSLGKIELDLPAEKEKEELIAEVNKILNDFDLKIIRTVHSKLENHILKTEKKDCSSCQ